MTEKRFRVHEWVKYNYSEISEYTDENHTDNPLRNDEVTELLNELHEKYIDEYALRETLQQELQRVEEENKQLRQQINELQFNKTIGQQEYQRRVFYE